MKTYMYVAIRRDLSVPQQVVQSCHAAIEASKIYHTLDVEHPSVISIGVKTEKKLEGFRDFVKAQGFSVEEFREPDRGNELTSVAVYPVTEEARSVFKKFQLLK